jgi:hypothetical protein
MRRENRMTMAPPRAKVIATATSVLPVVDLKHPPSASSSACSKEVEDVVSLHINIKVAEPTLELGLVLKRATSPL